MDQKVYRNNKYQESIQYILYKEQLYKGIAHNKISSTIWNLKPEWWGEPSVQEEKYQG
jgi:hypothetical protein